MSMAITYSGLAQLSFDLSQRHLRRVSRDCPPHRVGDLVANTNGLLADPRHHTMLRDELKMIVVLGPRLAAVKSILLLGPANVLGPIAHIVRQRVGQAMQLAERWVAARSVESVRGQGAVPHLGKAGTSVGSVEGKRVRIYAETIGGKHGRLEEYRRAPREVAGKRHHLWADLQSLDNRRWRDLRLLGRQRVLLLDQLDFPLDLRRHAADGLACFARCSTAAGCVDRRDGLLIADHLGLRNLVIRVGSVFDEVAITRGCAGRGRDAGDFALPRGCGVAGVGRLQVVLPT
jgi:hypothetical protein